MYRPPASHLTSVRSFGTLVLSLLTLNLLLVFPYAAAASGGLNWLPALNQNGSVFGLLRWLLLRDEPDVLRISAELLILIGAAWLLRNRLSQQTLRRAGYVILAALYGYLLYDAAMRLAFAKPPIFYEDLLILPDALNLIVDAWSPTLALGVIGGLFALLATAGVIRASWRRIVAAICRSNRGKIREGIDAENPRSGRPGFAHIAYAVAAAYVLFVSVWFRVDENIDRIGARWIFPKIAQNISASLRWHRALSELDAASAPLYYRFDAREDKANARRGLPNVYLFMVESYGARLYQEDDSRAAMWSTARELDNRLRRAGYHGFSAYSEATIRGGRSWLSIASVFSGVRIDNQAVYRLFAGVHDQVPHMGRYLRDQGYYTVGLQPTVRERPGVPRSNYYAFEQPVFHRELSDYAGSAYGWGYYPDQYSLFYTADHYLEQNPRPHFLFFMGVTSHAPWDEGHLPPLVDDYRELARSAPHTLPASINTNGGPGPQRAGIIPAAASESGIGARILQSVRNHLAGAGAAMSAANCQRFVAYDLEVIARFMEQRITANNAERDAIVIILGDHQPGFVSGPAQDSRTPLHIFSRNPGWLRALAANAATGFQAGFVPPDADTPAALGHAGIYPLLARLLQEQPPDTSELHGLPAETLLRFQSTAVVR